MCVCVIPQLDLLLIVIDVQSHEKMWSGADCLILGASAANCNRVVSLVGVN